MILHDWEAIRQAGPQQVGGKAWNLARLARYGMNLPSGQAIGVSAYRQWLDSSGLETELLVAAHEEEEERSTVLAEVVARLADIPTGLDLAGLAEVPWAVRSSAPQEDSSSASFAGIHTSFLNVQGDDALEQAVRGVWLSLWSPAAVAYRERIGLAHAEASMAVLLMPLIPAKASGIAFSRDPLSGRDDRMVIHAAHGLGESLVGGLTTGDEIILAEDLLDDSLSVLHVTPGDKSVRVDAASGGGTEVSHLAADPEPVLNEVETRQLGEQLRLAAVALDYSRPDFDLEWAWDGEQFWLLQARPITASNRCTYPELAAQPDIWTRGNTRDVVPDPLSPIDWGISRRMVNALLRQGFSLAGLKLHPGVQRAGLFRGRLYLNLSLMQWEAYASVGLLPKAMNRLIGGHQPEIEIPPPTAKSRMRQALNTLRYLLKAPARRKAGRRSVDEVMATAAAWMHEPLPQSDAEFDATLREFSRYSRSASDLHFLQGSASGALSFLVDNIEACLPGEGHALAAALMAVGPSSVTAQQGYDLIAIAKQAMGDPLTRKWLEQRTPGSDSDWLELPESNAFRRAFAEFLERYGHRGVYETYTRNPSWREQPGYLLDSLLELAETDLAALESMRVKSASDARMRVVKAFPWWKRFFLDGLIREAKAGSNEREAARSAIIALLEAARRVLLALGERWVEAGWLAEADEIFFLMQAEIYAVLNGVLPGSALAPRVNDRREQFEVWLAEEAPDVILEQADGVIAEQIDDEKPLMANGDSFIGIPVGAGRITGTARLLHSPEQGGQLARGEILVVPSTDPAWTPLFLKAGGLVMETGGYLSHGAIVAREFGIPAVVNLPGILQQLQDGDRLEVDGGKGVVRRLTT
ncbi:MAG: PEP/pyruvate-binding domain-containing protein [Candidatus Thiodiazotropha sp.]